MHKLFVICDDPNGVEEGNSSSRRSFSCVPKEERGEKKRKKKNKKQSAKLSTDDIELQRTPSVRRIHKIAKGSVAVEDTQVPIHGSRAGKRVGSVKENIGAMLTRSRSGDERRCLTGTHFESPNLVAKLMGLEEVPSNPRVEVEKIIGPVFEMSPSRVTEKLETEDKTLKKVLEIVKSKGLLTMAYDSPRESDDVETSLVLIKPISRARGSISETIDEEKAREVRVRKIASHLEVVRRLDKEQFDAKLKKIKLKLEHRKRMLLTSNFPIISHHEHTSSSDFDVSKALVRKTLNLDSKSAADTCIQGADDLENCVKRLLDRDLPGSESLKARVSKDLEAKLVLDFASEYVERKKVGGGESVSGWGGFSGEKMVEEIRRGMETLKGFHPAGENDKIYEAWENDMRVGCYVSGTWEVGWRRGFSPEDEEKAVADVGNLLLFDLIRELFL